VFAKLEVAARRKEGGSGPLGTGESEMKHHEKKGLSSCPRRCGTSNEDKIDENMNAPKGGGEEVRRKCIIGVIRSRLSKGQLLGGRFAEIASLRAGKREAPCREERRHLGRDECAEGNRSLRCTFW